MRGRRAIILPGARYTTARPLLHFTRIVLASHGWTVHEESWPIDDSSARDPQAMVASAVTQFIDAARDARLLIVGKSIGSLAIPIAADRDIPGIWITPLLHDPAVAGAVDKLPAATLLVGSTGDESWDADSARASGHEVLELTDANHGLELDGDPLGSIDVLGDVIAAVDRFVARIDTAGA